MSTIPASLALLPDLCRHLLQAGLSVLIQSTLLLLLGWGVGAVLRRRSLALQCLAYRVTFGGVLACVLLSGLLAGRFRPLVGLDLPSAHQAPEIFVADAREVSNTGSTALRGGNVIGAASSAPLRDATGQPVRVQVLPAVPVVKTDSSVRSDPWFRDFLRPEPSRASLLGWSYVALVGVWLAGAVGLLAWLLLCYLGVWRLRRKSLRIEDGVVGKHLEDLCAAQGLRPPLLLASREVQSVFLTGLRRPAILLPASYAADFDALTLRAILSHEVAHLARKDELWTLFTRLLRSVLWLQPLLWLVCRQWEQASEEVCDLAVLQQDVPPREYAECLLRLAGRFVFTRAEQVVGAGILTFRSSLGQRIQRLLERAAQPAPALPPRIGIAVALGMSAVIMPILFLVSVSAAFGEDTWASDARLERRVAITAEGLPVGDLLTLLSQKTGVSLRANDYVADDKVIIFGPARPLRQVLADLAALFNDVWVPGKGDDGRPHYLLARAERAKEYEDTLAQDGDQRMLAQLDAQVKALHETPEELAKRPASDPIRTALTNREGHAATEVFALLSPQQRQQLIERWNLPLPVAALSPALKTQIEDMFFGKRFEGTPVTPYPPGEMEKTELNFGLLGQGRFGILWVIMQAPTGYYYTMTQLDSRSKFLLPPHGDPYTGKGVPAKAALPDPGLVGKASGEGWPDRLRSLAEKTGMPLLADYYRSKPVVVAADANDAAPAGTAAGALDGFCRPQGYLWWTQGQTLLFRKRDWYYQRLYEVPDRWILALARQLQAHKSQATYADVLSLLELTTSQMVGLDASLGGSADRRLLAGLRELLAMTNTAMESQRLPKNAPVFKGVVGGDISFADAAVKPNPLDPNQHQATAAFVDAFFSTLPTDSVSKGDFGVILLPNQKIEDPAHATHLQMSANLYIGHNTLRAGYLFELPMALPDDRRDKTRINVMP